MGTQSNESVVTRKLGGPLEEFGVDLERPELASEQRAESAWGPQSAELSFDRRLPDRHGA